MACPDICAIIGVTETCIARNLMLSVGTLTVWISAAEVLAALLESPLYCAVSEWLPTASEEIVKLAMPAASDGYTAAHGLPTGRRVVVGGERRQRSRQPIGEPIPRTGGAGTARGGHRYINGTDPSW